MKKITLKNRILAAAACILLLISALVLPIGAEDAQPTWEIDQPEDTLAWLDYPGANLIKYPYNSQNNEISGVTFNVTNQEIKIQGYSTNPIYFYLNTTINLEVNQTYTLSGIQKNTNTYITIFFENTRINYIDNGNNVTFNAPINKAQIYLYIPANQEINTTIQPMLNKGDVAYPFMPYLPYVMDQYYQQGNTDGNAEGYQNGYQAGEQNVYENINDMQQNIFDKATFDSGTTFSTDPEINMFINNFTPDKTESGVYFNKLHQRIINNKGESFCQEYMEDTFITLTWADEDAWNWSLYGLSIQGDSMVQSATLNTIDGKKYTLDASGNSADLRQFTILETDVSYPVTVKSIRIRIGRSYDLLTSFTILNQSKEYNLGYTNGYVAGVTDNDSDQYTAGFIAGKKDGILIGKQEGLELAKKGDWTNLFTAVVEAPVNTFQSLFNFEILGLDMRAAFGSILAICVLLIIIKKVIL